MKTLKSKKTETGYIILNNQNEILYTFDMIVNDICDSKDDYSGMNWYKKTISKKLKILFIIKLFLAVMDKSVTF